MPGWLHSQALLRSFWLLYFSFAGLGKVFHTPESLLHGLAGVTGLSIAAAFTLGISMYMWAQGGDMAFYQVSFENDGLRFRLGTKEAPQEQFFAWDQIADDRI